MKRSKNYALKCNLYLYILILQKLLISGEKCWCQQNSRGVSLFFFFFAPPPPPPLPTSVSSPDKAHLNRVNVKIKTTIYLRITFKKISDHKKSVHGFILQIVWLVSIWCNPSPEGISDQIANSAELLKLVKSKLKRFKLLSKRLVS